LHSLEILSQVAFPDVIFQLHLPVPRAFNIRLCSQDLVQFQDDDFLQLPERDLHEIRFRLEMLPAQVDLSHEIFHTFPVSKHVIAREIREKFGGKGFPHEDLDDQELGDREKIQRRDFHVTRTHV